MTRGAVLVTGASSGIGRACALHLDALGFEVLAGVRREQDALSLQAGGSSRLHTPILDVTDRDAIDQLVAQLDGRPLAGIVNNAGIAVGGPLEFVPVDALRNQLEVNVIALVAITQAVLASIRAGRGRIVNIGSISGRQTSPLLGPYAASKHAVVAITDALRQELRPWGLHVAVVEPGTVATPIWDKAGQAVEALEASLPDDGRRLYGDALTATRALISKTRPSSHSARPCREGRRTRPHLLSPTDALRGGRRRARSAHAEGDPARPCHGRHGREAVEPSTSTVSSSTSVAMRP